MQTFCLKVHGQQQSIFGSSKTLTSLNPRSQFRLRPSHIWTRTHPLKWVPGGLATCYAVVQRRPYTGTTSLGLLDHQEQNNGKRTRLEASPNEVKELRILERAQALGIMTMTDLLREADLGAQSQDVTLLINRHPYSHNLELWCILLEFKRLRYGVRGVFHTWHLMKDKAGTIEEFFHGSISDHLWSILISEGVKRHDFAKRQDFLLQLCKHEIKWGRKRSSLFVDVVGTLLAHNSPTVAHRFSQLLQPFHPVTEDDAWQLFTQACNSSEERALWNFRNVCQTFGKVPLYSRVITHLCSQERFLDAWAMHKYFLSRGDLPPDFDSIKPLVKYVASVNGGLEELLQDFKDHDISFEAQARRLHEHEKSLQYGIASGSLNIVSSRTMGVQPSRLSDHFVARAFATRAFSLSFTLHGLRLLGLREVGPLALRQIGLSAGSPSETCRRLELLRELGIDCGSSAYARTVTSLAAQDQATLLSDILASDQHPDVFEDLDLQEKLLAQYYRDSDWRQVARTLAVVRVSKQEFWQDKRLSEEETSLNVMLRCLICVRDWFGVSRSMAQMEDQGCPLSTATLRCMHDTILPHRKPGERPNPHRGFDDLGFLLGLFQNAKNAGIHIPPSFWWEPIRRLGMLRRWADLERLLFWLAARYSRKAGPPDDRPSKFKRIIISSGEDSLDRIFTLPLQRAIVAWADQYPNPRRTLSRAPFQPDIDKRRFSRKNVHFTRGVRVLRSLQLQYGVQIDVATVRLACYQRLRKHFAPDEFSGQPVKYQTHRKYDASLLSKSVRLLNRAWSGTLFPNNSATQLQKDIFRPRRLRRMPRPRLKRHHRRQRASIHAGHLQHDDKKDQVHGKGQPYFDLSQSPANVNAEPGEDVVMYRDIFNVALEDYERPASGSSRVRKEE